MPRHISQSDVGVAVPSPTQLEARDGIVIGSIKDSEQSITGTGWASVTASDGNLSAMLAAGQDYFLHYMLYMQTSATADCRVRFLAPPGGASADMVGRYAAYCVEQAQEEQNDLFTASALIALPTDNCSIQVRATIRCITSGELRLQIRNNSDATNIIRQFSTLTVSQILPQS